MDDKFTTADNIRVQGERAQELLTRVNAVAKTLPSEQQGELIKIANEIRSMAESLKKTAGKL
jgi:hypothetical protein